MSEIKSSIRVEMPEETIIELGKDKIRFKMSSMNELYNTIINNYVDESPVNMRDLVSLKNILLEEAQNLTSSQVRGIIDRVARNSIKDLQVNNPNRIVSISVKPTQVSEQGFRTLHQICNIDHFSSMTKAIRNLLISYSKLTVIEREKIIFRDTISTLQNAINNHLQVSISHASNEYVIKPYMFVNPLDDFSNYLIAQDQNNAFRLFRLIRIKVIKVIEYSTFSISSKLSKELNLYSKEITIFNDDMSKILKDALNKSETEDVFRYALNFKRGSSGNEKYLKAL